MVWFQSKKCHRMGRHKTKTTRVGKPQPPQVVPQDYTLLYSKQVRYIMFSNQREINSCHLAGSPSQNASSSNTGLTAVLGSEDNSFTQHRRRSSHPFGADTGTYPMGVNQSSYDNHHDRASRVLEIIDSVLSILEQDDQDGIFEWTPSNSTTTTTSKLNNGRQARQ
jgi:hypothetical protein